MESINLIMQHGYLEISYRSYLERTCDGGGSYVEASTLIPWLVRGGCVHGLLWVGEFVLLVGVVCMRYIISCLGKECIVGSIESYSSYTTIIVP